MLKIKGIKIIDEDEYNVNGKHLKIFIKICEKLIKND
jgi:hypothetical protein